MSDRTKSYITQLLKAADVEIGGTRPWDVKVLDDRLFGRVMTQGTLGLGEAYMDGWWECEAIDQLIYRLLKYDVKAHMPIDLSLVVGVLRSRVMNLQRLKAFEVGEKHYDIGNDLYA